MTPPPPSPARAPGTRLWLVPLVMCLAGAAWLAHDRPAESYGLPVAVTLAFALPALAVTSAGPTLRAKTHALLVAAVPLAPVLISAPALLERGDQESVRLWARVDHLVALAALLSAAPGALRRTNDRLWAAAAAAVSALGLALLVPSQPGWGVGGVLVALGACAPLLVREPGPAATGPAGVGVLRPARGGGFQLSPPAQALFDLRAPGPYTLDQLVAVAAARDQARLRAALTEAQRGGAVNLDLTLMDADGRSRHLLLDGAEGELELRALDQTTVGRRARGADRAALAASLGGLGILVLGRDGAIIETNDVLERFAEPFAGPAGWWQRVQFVREQTFAAAHTETHEAGATADQVELAVPGGAGRRVFLVRQRHLGDGEVLVTAEDLTGAVESAEARRQAEERLTRELEHLRERQVNSQALLASINHEMRNPINIIKGFAELMHDEAPAGGARDDLARIVTQARRLSRLVEDATRLSADAPHLDRQPFDLSGVLDEVSHAVHRRMLEKRNSLRVTYPAQPVRMVGDRASLVQVLERLLDNAARFTELGTVHFSADRGDGENVELVIHDTGRGMSPDQLALLDQPFWQRAAATTEAAGGLGLQVVKSLVARMGGTLQVNSGGSTGTMVHLTLPREARAAMPTWEPARGRNDSLSGEDLDGAPSGGRNRTVLLQGLTPPPARLANGPGQRKGGA